jgi:hypothetical protein
VPKVLRPDALAAAYAATRRKIDDLPTVMLQSGATIFRSFNPTSAYSLLPKPPSGGHVSKLQANKLLIPGDGAIDLNNRFSGPSYDPAIPAAAGLYCVLQQQALVNESAHYGKKARVWALSGRCVLKMRLMGSMLVADLSPHNPKSSRFLRELGRGTWDEMTDPKDCSVARGIGLAIAETATFRGLAVQTVRESERSAEERGDNLVLFASPGTAITGVYLEEAYYYGKRYDPEIFPVEFP